MRIALRLVAAAAIGACCLFPTLAVAQYSFLAHLEGAQEVPPSGSQAFGTGVFAYVADAQMVSYSLAYFGVSSPTAVHIHGPAPTGQGAGVLFTLSTSNPTFGLLGPITAQQAADMQAGLWYVNVHSPAHPNGEIRGQLINVTAVEQSTWSRVRALYAR